MRNAKQVLIATSLISFTLLFQNCSPVGFKANTSASTKNSVAGNTVGSPGSEGSSTPTGGVTTGNPGIDGDSAPIINGIADADPEFDPSNVYYVKFDLLETLITDLAQLVYTPNPQACHVTWDWTLLILSFKGNRQVNTNACGGFIKAAQVAEAQTSGACTARVADSKTFGFAPVINFVRTSEIGSDCTCFRRYVLDIFGGRAVMDEVRVFAAPEVCAADFSEYN